MQLYFYFFNISDNDERDKNLLSQENDHAGVHPFSISPTINYTKKNKNKQKHNIEQVDNMSLRYPISQEYDHIGVHPFSIA